jgi:uncharacterized cupin superfamily protein
MSKPTIVNLEDLPLNDAFPRESDQTGTIPEKAHGSKWTRIGPLIGAEKLGCALTVVPPHGTAFPYHRHTANEEWLLVLSGTGVLRHDEDELPLRTGDVIALLAGSSHQVRNVSDEELRYLCFSTLLYPEITEYPDSGKVMSVPVPDRRKGHITRLADKRPYWDGETLE